MVVSAPGTVADRGAVATQRRLGIQPALTGLRGVAIAFVLAHHYVAYLLPMRLAHLASGGFLGVDVFFVLSGFLITTLLLEEADRTRGTISLRRFYSGRALRLLPPVVLLLIGYDLMVAWTRPHPVPLHEVVRSNLIVFFYATNWFQSLGTPIAEELNHTWSLAVEEQFYFVWPLIVIIALRLGGRTWMAVTALLAAICAIALWRAHLYTGPASWPKVYERSDARADTLLVGALASVLWRAGWITPRRLRPIALPCAVVIVLSAQYAHRDSARLYDAGFTLLAFASATVIVSVIGQTRGLGAVLSWRPLVALGEISYGVYVFHMLVLATVIREFHARALERGAVALAITLAVATASYLIVERPLRDFRRRRRSALVAEAAAAEVSTRPS